MPGLFEGDEYATLMTQCKEGAQREGLMLDSADELYKWFTNQVRSEGFRQNVLQGTGYKGQPSKRLVFLGQ